MNYKNHGKDNQRRGEDNQSKRGFYFSNVYDDKNDAEHTAWNVKNDLDPFRSYIQTSIENLRSLGEISAEVREVKPKILLIPEQKVIKLEPLSSLRVKKPEGSYYSFSWDEDEYGYTDGFAALDKGRKPILEGEDKFYFYNGSFVFSYEGEELDGKELKLYTKKGGDDEYKVRISRLDYSDTDSYSISCVGAEIYKVISDRDSLICLYKGEASRTVTFFGTLEIEAKKEKKPSAGALFSDAEGVFSYDGDAGLFVIPQGERLPVISDGVSYEELDARDIYNLVCEADKAKLSLEGGELSLADGSFPEKIKKMALVDGRLLPVESSSAPDGAITFKAVRQDAGPKKSHKNTVLLELVEDERTMGELMSNVSYFFLESVEEVKDSRGNRYSFRKHENFSQIEIELPRAAIIPDKLYIVPNEYQLRKQLMALESLMNTPAREHRPLLELMRNKYDNYGNLIRRRWDSFSPADVSEWFTLRDDNYDGCENQRDFVKKALATPDFAILEGPPGSGKTTTILEIIAQAVKRGKKVMLAASTNAAIDNILERLGNIPEEIRNKLLAVRIGKESAISESVKNYTVFDIKEDYQNEIISRANLVCGTIIGILRHPEFKLNERPACPMYDYLIIDEASKTTFQEFLVPAVYSRRWILSGDLKQLTPYVDKDNLAASLKNISAFDKDKQNAKTVLMHIKSAVYENGRNRKENIKPSFVLKATPELIGGMLSVADDYEDISVVAISDKLKNERVVSLGEYESGAARAIAAWGCDVLLVDGEVYPKISDTLPPYFIPLLYGEEDICSFKSEGYWRKRGAMPCVAGRDPVGKIADLSERLGGIIKDKPWADEIAWRLARMQELFMLSDVDNKNSTVDNYEREIRALIPKSARGDIEKQIELIREIALPSIIQLLQKGISDGVTKNKKRTTLNDGFDSYHLEHRHTLLEYQHRMHPDISSFSSEQLYGGGALKNGRAMTGKRAWGYGEERGWSSRAVWLDVKAGGDRSNQNEREIGVIVGEIEKFLRFSKENPKKDGEMWTVACLTYYAKQESELRRVISKKWGNGRKSGFCSVPECNAEIEIYTVDKFQGKEADVVFLSTVKSGKAPLGFMDSPNRLNVALTRAKYQRVIVGSLSYFKNQNKSILLKKLATEQ